MEIFTIIMMVKKIPYSHAGHWGLKETTHAFQLCMQLKAIAMIADKNFIVGNNYSNS